MSLFPWVLYYDPHNSPEVVSSTGAATLGKQWAMSGEDTPNFNRKKNRGDLIPYTRYLHQEQYVSFEGDYQQSFYRSPGVYDHYRSTGPWTGELDIAPSSLFPSLGTYLAEADFDHLVQKSAAKIYSRGFDFLTFVAELHKVVDMFRNFLKRLNKLLDDAKRLGDAWLEGRYGWRTLLYDIQDINQAIENLNRESARLHASAKDENVFTSVTEMKMTPLSWYFNVYANVEEVITVSTRGTITADINPPNIAINPFVTAWELIPYSFVVDWILSVGQSIQALSFVAFSHEYTAAGGVMVSYKKTFTFSRIDNTYPTPEYLQGSATVNGYAEMVVKKRVPTSVSYLPQWRLNFDWLKVVDLVTLVIQRLK
jgi:hypothetical protein